MVAGDALQLLRDHSPHDRYMRWALHANGIRNLNEDPHEAEASFREAIRFEEHMIGSVQHETLHLLMTAMFSQGRINEAIEDARATAEYPRAPSHPTFGRTRTVVGFHYLGFGDFESAEQQCNLAAEHGITHMGREHFATREAQFMLAQALASQDDIAKQARAQDIFAKLLPITRAGVQTEDELNTYAFTYIVGSLQSPSPDDVQLALEANQRVLEKPLNRAYRLRNLYAGALVQHQAGNVEEAKEMFQQVLESNVYRWFGVGGDPAYFILRNAEDNLARMLLSSGNTTAAEQSLSKRD